MEQDNVFKVTGEKDLIISGEGTRGKPIRVFLLYSETPYTIVIKDTEINENISSYENCKQNTILYYRLRNNNILKIKNVFGRVKIL